MHNNVIIKFTQTRSLSQANYMHSDATRLLVSYSPDMCANSINAVCDLLIA